ncbi:hypothetical protein E2C01_060560 [Portunus trituberculatus]|uniref:Uncharacterized protein n=1 Tax=Portunus trituberculatus TaxID=210409 RepID=A0A5B7H8F3_PORTR|nr:hypothetical protein [Portunus trituberculatus]
MKCEIPSFVADFVSVQAWVDSEGHTYYPTETNYGNARSPLRCEFSRTYIFVHVHVHVLRTHCVLMF